MADDIVRMGDPRHPDTTGKWVLVPPAAGVCSQCAVDHEPEEPHNAQSVHYQYAFYAEHGRWPTWGDALAHCSPELRAAWAEQLAGYGVTLDGPVTPPPAPPRT